MATLRKTHKGALGTPGWKALSYEGWAYVAIHLDSMLAGCHEGSANCGFESIPAQCPQYVSDWNPATPISLLLVYGTSALQGHIWVVVTETTDPAKRNLSPAQPFAEAC